ncbi:MAG: hypothetical protein AB1479_02955 [Pseudomonadota bacterium]
MTTNKHDAHETQDAMQAIHARFHAPRLETRRFGSHQKRLAMAWIPKLRAALKKTTAIIDSEASRDS